MDLAASITPGSTSFKGRLYHSTDKRDCRNGKGYDGGCGSIAFSYQKSGEWNKQDQQDQEWDAFGKCLLSHPESYIVLRLAQTLFVGYFQQDSKRHSKYISEEGGKQGHI